MFELHQVEGVYLGLEPIKQIGSVGRCHNILSSNTIRHGFLLACNRKLDHNCHQSPSNSTSSKIFGL